MAGTLHTCALPLVVGRSNDGNYTIRGALDVVTAAGAGPDTQSVISYHDVPETPVAQSGVTGVTVSYLVLWMTRGDEGNDLCGSNATFGQGYGTSAGPIELLSLSR